MLPERFEDLKQSENFTEAHKILLGEVEYLKREIEWYKAELAQKSKAITLLLRRHEEIAEQIKQLLEQFVPDRPEGTS